MPILSPAPQLSLVDDGLASQYARHLLGDLGASVSAGGRTEPTHPARRWAESGLMSLPGGQGSSTQLCPVPLPSCADGALEAFRTLAHTRIFPDRQGARLLVERAAITSTETAGTLPSAEHCRLLHSADGVIVLNLARDSDWELLPALFERESVADWPDIARLTREQPSLGLVSRGRLLGLAAADAGTIPRDSCSWMKLTHTSSATARRGETPRVIDLSSLWAGPLCSSLWQAAGAEVIKVESSQRPDGAKEGSRAFFDLLNNGKTSVVLDLHRQSGQDELVQLIRQADIVLEGSRPRGLRQMGIVAEELIEQVPGLTWVSITGYGRQEPQCNWIAYGDDAAVAAGLSAVMHQATGQWLVCGDAIADPLTGIHAALAGWAGWLSGGGKLIDLSLERTVRHCITRTAPPDGDYRARYSRWERYLRENKLAPQAPASSGEEASSAH